jgi:hypothetical protein
LTDLRILIAFGVMLVVVLGSRVMFQRKALRTRQRIGLSLVAIALTLVGFVRKGSLDTREIVLAVAVFAILGFGILYLQKSEGKDQPHD